MQFPTRNTKLIDAIIWWWPRRLKGEECPMCGHVAKTQKRRVSPTMATALADFYRLGGTSEYIHGPSVVPKAKGDEAKLRYWGLTEGPVGDVSPGHWKVTPLGEKFLLGEAPIKEFALVWEGEQIGYEGEEITIRDVLGRAFGALELMKLESTR